MGVVASNIVPKFDFFVINLKHSLQVGRQYVMYMKYSGNMTTDNMWLGFIASLSGTRYIASTHLEPTYARAVFPCFDEPSLKATFDITVKHRLGRFALSNMPNIRNYIQGEWNTAYFNTTAAMSTYLVAVVVSDFKCKEAVSLTGLIHSSERDWVAALAMLLKNNNNRLSVNSRKSLACSRLPVVLQRYMEQSTHAGDFADIIGDVRDSSLMGFQIALNYTLENFDTFSKILKMADEKESTDTPEMQSVAQTPTSEVQSVGREGSAVSGKSQAVSVTSDKTSDRNESKQLSESGRSSALSSSRGHPASASSQATSSKSAKRKDKIRKSSDDTVHKVTLTVTIAKAIPTVEEEGFKIEDMVKKKKRIVEAPKAQNYYHCSYYLLPDDTDATKTDIVTFGMAAKIYTEHESKVLKTWQEGDHTWVAWSHSHTVTVTKELLLKLFNHTLELRIWDSKDKVSSKARFDRPKAFRLPQAKSGEDPEDVGGVRSLVMKQSQSFIALQPKKSFISRPVPQNGPPGMHNIWKTDAKGRPMRETRATDTSHSIGKDKSTSDTSSKSLIYKSSSQNLRDLDASIVTDHQEAPYTLVSLPINSEQDLPIKSYSRLGRLAGAPDASEVKQMKKHIREQQQKRKEELKKKAPLSAKAKESRESIARLNEKQELQSKESLVHKKERIPASAPPSVGKKGTRETGQHKDSKRHAKKLEVAAAEKAADINKNGNCCIPVQMKILFSGVKSVTNRLDKPVPGIEDVFITVSLDGDLMSESQEQELNPLVIKVNYSDKLPNTPISYDELDRKCQPVYCKYTFYKQPEHKSIGRSHSSTVYWEDTNVVLLGMLDEGSVKEYLNGPPLEIEVHDRDRKAEEVKKEPTLFGEDVEDDKLGNVGMVTGKRTLHNPFTGRDKPWDPYGIAKFQLSDLLLGEKILNLTSPIHSCSIPDQMGFQVARNGRLLGVPNSVDGPRDLPLPMGHYLENNAQLKIRVEITYPLTTPKDLQQKSQMETRPQCPMSRIIYMFQYMNTKFLHHLQGLVTAINARALNLDSMPKHVVEAALSTYKLSEEQQRSCDLDIVTGFHVMDGQIHIFVLEGLRDQAIQQLWQTLPHPSIEGKYNRIMSEVVVFYYD
uniref:Uncharacterized protein LOC100373146 n=1 Tax=Saccoglossus kowalevskii TaxID=10224 RepID=A0ABM0MYN8_SACKO|nr:PREDICTED: uncharacterized protein LOC100373146 [Saccoglossus kowalevskii]